MPTKLPTATVSVAFTLDEAQLVRDAAAMLGLTVSQWATTRTIVAASTAATRSKTAKVAERISTATAMQRGTRQSRISMVMRVQDHESLKQASKAVKLPAHTFAQAALLDAADTELHDVPPVVRRQAEAQRKAEKTTGSLLVSVPKPVAQIKVEPLGELVCQLLAAMRAQIFAGNGAKIAAGIHKTVAKASEGPMLTVKLNVPEFDVRAVAFILDVPPATLATAFAIKAAANLKA